jgi:hypothetical protein
MAPSTAMTAATIDSIEGLVHVERLAGTSADLDAAPDLLVEVPHGACRRAHYDAVRSTMRGPLPDDLHVFFHVNTDVGAWDYGRRVAERVVQAHPGRQAWVVRCLLPRTFIDANRLEETSDDLARGGMTAGLAPYVKDPRDIEALVALHRAYVEVAERAYAAVCGAGGFALSPHTYGPRTMAIPRIDETIVTLLREAHAPGTWESWPVRPEVDFVTRTPEGALLAPEGMAATLVSAFAKDGIEAAENATYAMHPSTQGHRFSARYPGQVLSLEVRRDLLVEAYTPFDEMTVRPEAADRFAAPIAHAIDAWLRAKGR